MNSNIWFQLNHTKKLLTHLDSGTILQMLPKELGHLEKDEKRNKEINQTSIYLTPKTRRKFFLCGGFIFGLQF